MKANEGRASREHVEFREIGGEGGVLFSKEKSGPEVREGSPVCRAFFGHFGSVDSLDAFSLIVIAALGGMLCFLLLTFEDEKSPARDRQQERAAVAAINPEYEKRIMVAKDLLNNNNLAKAEEIVTLLAKEFPYDGQPRMLLGDIHWRRQEPVEAMLQYTLAVDLNPDFLDKKTQDFQGKKIKRVLEEVQATLEQMEKGGGSAEGLREHWKVYHYMQRRLAGSCG